MPKFKPEDPEPGETRIHEKRESKGYEKGEDMGEDRPRRQSPVKARRHDKRMGKAC
jgi:hypothetical protein